MASAFTPKEGIAQEWITSADVTKIRTSVWVGKTTRWSTSSKRKSPGFSSSVGTMYESNSIFKKSEYS